MKEQGSITIYFSLILGVILALLCTLLESTRVGAINTKAEGSTYMGLDSVFAEYTSELFEKYGVLFLWCSQEQFSQKLEDYIAYNLDMKKGTFLVKNTELYRISLEDVTIKAMNYATDNNGDLFGGQVQKYMKYQIAGGVVEQILEDSNIFGQGKAVNTFIQKAEEFKEKFEKAQECVTRIEEKIENIKKTKENPQKILEDLIFKAVTAKEKMETSQDYASQYTEYKNLSKQLFDTKEAFVQGLKDIETKIEEYEEAVKNAKEDILKLNTQLEESKEVLEEDIKSFLNGEVNPEENQGYSILQNQEVVKDYLGRLEKLAYFFENSTGELSPDTIKENIKSLEQLKIIFEGFSMENLKGNGKKTGGEKGMNILDFIKNLKQEGVLGLVVSDLQNISKESVDAQNLPSREFENTAQNISQNETVSGEESLIDVSGKKAVYSQYLLTHFGNYVNKLEDTKLQYELEYILGRKSSDRENLEEAVNNLLLLREGCNLLYLIKDTQKRSEAYQMAISIVGFTGIPVLITITQLLILAAWAYGESILDVRSLLAGEKVPIVKNSSEWKLSLAGIKELKNSTGTDGGAGRGMEYDQYLRILLLMQKQTLQYYGTMDIIQLNLCKWYNESFQMNECIYSTQAQVKYSAGPMFVTLPLIKGVLGYRRGNYPISITQQYEY